MARFPCEKATVLAVLVVVMFADTEGSVIHRRSDYSMYDYNFNRVGDTDLDNEVTDCGLVRHQYQKGYIRLREYLERIQGCGREGKLKNIEGIADSTMDGVKEDEIKGIAAATMDDLNDDLDDLGQDGRTSSVVKSPNQKKPPINIVSKGSFQPTSQSHQGQRLSYQGAPAALAPGKSSQYNTFARPLENRRPAARNPATSTYSAQQNVMKNDRPLNSMSLINTFYPGNGVGQKTVPAGKFYLSNQNAPNRYAVQVGKPLERPAMTSSSINSFRQSRIGPQRYFTQNSPVRKPSLTEQHQAITQIDQNSFEPKNEKNLANSDDDANKIKSAQANNNRLSDEMSSLDSSPNIDDGPAEERQLSTGENASPTKMVYGITTAAKDNSPKLKASSTTDDSKTEGIDGPATDNSASAADQLDPVDSNPDAMNNEPQADDKHARPKNLEINLDMLKEKIMHSTNANFLRRMLTLIRKITHHKDFRKLGSNGQNIVMKADRTVHALNTAYKQAQRDRLEMLPPRDPPSMPPAINTDLMDDDVITKKFQIERRPYQYQPRPAPLYSNPYYNLQRWQYGLYNGNTLE